MSRVKEMQRPAMPTVELPSGVSLLRFSPTAEKIFSLDNVFCYPSLTNTRRGYIIKYPDGVFDDEEMPYG